MPALNPHEDWKDGETPDFLEGASYWPQSAPTIFDDLRSADANLQPYEWPTEPEMSKLEELASMPVTVVMRMIAERLKLKSKMSLIGRAAVGFGASIGYAPAVTEIIHANRKQCDRRPN